MVIAGLYTSSNKYKRRIEGIPIKINTKDGTIVQNNSKDWDSIKNLFKILLLIVEKRLKPTIQVMRIRIVIVWLWKKINCSIRGEEAFWKFIA